jgi:hypothetical protein
MIEQACNEFASYLHLLERCSVEKTGTELFCGCISTLIRSINEVALPSDRDGYIH